MGLPMVGFYALAPVGRWLAARKSTETNQLRSKAELLQGQAKKFISGFNAEHLNLGPPHRGAGGRNKNNLPSQDYYIFWRESL